MYKVLIVDDEKWIRLGLRSMLNLEALQITEVLEAADAREAIRVFRAHQPQIVLSDVRLPVEDGCTLCEWIYDESPGTRLVMISGYNEFDYARRALQYQAVDYLLKPVDRQHLNDTVARCIAQLAEQPHSPVSQEDPDLIAGALRYIRENYSGKLTLRELAASCYVSETYFSYLFKKVVGVPPIQYITDLRIGKARELLQGSDLKVTEIARLVGYPDQHYFTKVFKKVTGESPTDYKLREAADEAGL